MLFHPAYEDITKALLENMALKGYNKVLVDETRRCLLAGLVRPNWLVSPDECSEHIEKADNQREKIIGFV